MIAINALLEYDHNVICLVLYYLKIMSCMILVCIEIICSFTMIKEIISPSVLQIRQQKMTPKDPNIGMKLQRRPLNELRGIFPKGSLEEMIDICRDPVLGEDYFMHVCICFGLIIITSLFKSV